MAIDRADERLLTVNEVAERLRIHPITVRRHIKAGRLRAVRVGRSVRIREADVGAFMRPGAGATEAEWARRRKIMEETFARRDRRGNIGIDTLELVRASRRELEERGEQR